MVTWNALSRYHCFGIYFSSKIKILGNIVSEMPVTQYFVKNCIVLAILLMYLISTWPQLFVEIQQSNHSYALAHMILLNYHIISHLWASYDPKLGLEIQSMFSQMFTISQMFAILFLLPKSVCVPFSVFWP